MLSCQHQDLNSSEKDLQKNENRSTDNIFIDICVCSRHFCISKGNNP